MPETVTRKVAEKLGGRRRLARLIQDGAIAIQRVAVRGHMRQHIRLDDLSAFALVTPQAVEAAARAHAHECKTGYLRRRTTPTPPSMRTLDTGAAPINRPSAPDEPEKVLVSVQEPMPCQRTLHMR